MKILLVHPPYMRKPKEVPLGIAYIASFLRQCGHNVGVLDIDAYGYSRREVEEIIIESDYDCFGVGGLSSRYSYVKWLASVMKAHHPSRLIIGGNMVATANPEALLKNTDIDIAVIGEGEMSCKELLEARLGLRDFDSIKGIAFKRNREVFFNPPRERIADLDSLPFPAWDLFAIKTYLRKPVFCEHGLRSMNIVATRGCPFECVYCSRAFGRRVTRRSATNIIAEI